MLEAFEMKQRRHVIAVDLQVGGDSANRDELLSLVHEIVSDHRQCMLVVKEKQ